MENGATNIIDEDDGEDWVTLSASTKATSVPLADVTISLSKKAMGHLGAAGGECKARATLIFRAEASDWLRTNGPRFQVQVGGKMAEKIRIVPDSARGEFELQDLPKTTRAVRLRIKHVNLWPDEHRDRTAAGWSIVSGCMVVVLPRAFVVATIRAPQAVPSVSVAVANPPPSVRPMAIAPQVVPPKRVIVDPEAQLQAEWAKRKASRVGVDLVSIHDEKVMRAALGLVNDFPLDIGGEHFQPAEAAILQLLLKRAEITRSSVLVATRDPENPDEDERDEKVVDVWLCRLRPKLERLGVEIETIWGGRFKMAVEHKGRLRKLIEEARGMLA